MLYKNHKQFRLPNHDYSEEGNYFVTICIKNHKNYFGKIVNGKMELSPLGEVAKKCWEELPKKFANIILYEYVIMPSHMHGIINIIPGRNVPRHVPTELNVYNSGIHPLTKNSISSIINHYKGAVKKWADKNDCNYFKWQLRFYDRIIRDDIEFYFIEEYIKNNPANFDMEKLLDEEKYLNEQFNKIKKRIENAASPSRIIP